MSRPPARAIAVSAELSWVDGAGPFRSPLRPSEASVPQAMPLADLLDRVARAADPKGAGVVLVLASDALKFLGLPDQLGAGAAHEAAPELVRAAGWKFPDELGHWCRAWRNERTGHTAAVYLVVPAWRGKFDPDLADGAGEDLADGAGVTRRLAAYHQATGAPYAIAPGYSAMVALRDGLARARNPYWCPSWDRMGTLLRLAERDLSWTAELVPADGWRHTYDAYAAHLGAAAAVEVASDQLQRVPDQEWDPKLAGYWQIDASAWAHTRMPSPTHGLEVDKGGRLWVCSPTMALLHQLTEEGWTDAPVVRDAWVAHGFRGVLRPWAEQLRDALAGLDTSGDAEILRAEFKATYRQAVGWFGKPKNRIVERPDWRHAIVSQGRTAIWRRAWRIGQNEDRWPLAIQTDSLTYASEAEDPEAAAPMGLTLGPWGLGKFRVAASEPAELVDA
jgi:hypothetical protein